MKRVILISILFFVLSGAYFAYKTFAATEPIELRGWAWSSNVGWISLTCDHSKDGTAAPNNVNNCSQSEYRVKLDPETSLFSGYAWSSGGGNTGAGWIKFDPDTTLAPEAPKLSARLVLISSSPVRYQVQGWIRACAGASDPINCSGGVEPNAGGWDGWIKMSGNTTNCPTPPESGPYETCLSSDGKGLRGFAWGALDLGWINFDTAYNGFSTPLGPGGVQIKEIKPR